MKDIIHAMLIGAVAGAFIAAVLIMVVFTQENAMNSSIHRVTSIKIDPDYLPDKRYQLVKVTIQSDDIEYELNLFTKDAMKIPVEFKR